MGVALLVVTVVPAIGLVAAARNRRAPSPGVIGLIWFDVALSGVSLATSLVLWGTARSTSNPGRVWQLPVLIGWWLVFVAGAFFLSRRR